MGPDTIVQPDLFVADPAEVDTGDWQNVKTLRLAVEILGPTTVRRDRFTKRRLYQDVGVPAYWIVDREHRLVEVWAPGTTRPVVETEQVRWHPEGARAPFVMDLTEVFGLG